MPFCKDFPFNELYGTFLKAEGSNLFRHRDYEFVYAFFSEIRFAKIQVFFVSQKFVDPFL